MSTTPFVPFGEDAPSFINANLAGRYLDSSSMPIFRYGLGGAMEQPDNSGFLPGATTTLPPSSYQTPMQLPEGVDPTTAWVLGQFRAMKKDANTDWKEQADYFFDKRREEAERANKMGQWNTIMGSVLKDLPRTLSEQYRRRNMYIGDMLRMQADQVREYGAGIRQSAASMPAMTNPPARNYIRI